MSKSTQSLLSQCLLVRLRSSGGVSALRDTVSPDYIDGEMLMRCLAAG
jgi:hypothetical protein